ncbi:MAG: DUF429 domain-containing protein [Alkalilacustris sp.]
MRVAGVDGCRGGWLAVTIERARPMARLVQDLAAVLADPGLVVLAVDTPIGLDAAPQPGGRATDRAARRALAAGAHGQRGVTSRVFSAPTSAQLAAWRAGADHAGVNAVHATGPRLSLQAFHILPKIDEADTLAAGDPRVVEVHPEVSFLMMAGATLPPKRLAAARARRAELLAGHGFDVTALAQSLGPARGRWQGDDLLDACAACWSARRIADGSAHRFPSKGSGAVILA